MTCDCETRRSKTDVVVFLTYEYIAKEQVSAAVHEFILSCWQIFDDAENSTAITSAGSKNSQNS